VEGPGVGARPGFERSRAAGGVGQTVESGILTAGHPPTFILSATGSNVTCGYDPKL
jgi:hypothetical protein